MSGDSRLHPWFASLALHGAALVVVAILVLPSSPEPPVLRMRLVTAGAGPSTAPKAGSPGAGGLPARTTPSRASEPPVPDWRGSSPSLSPEALSVPVPVSLDELLGPPPAEASVAAAPGGWSAGGEGYSPPPLPPPGLAPPQGSRWTLILSIPAGGGFATHFEGLDSGHRELDLWLENYLRTVSFPSSLDGRDYQLKWTLRLDSGRPQ